MISVRAVLRIIFVALLLLNAVAIFFSRRGYTDLRRIQAENQALSERLAKVKQEKERLNDKVVALKSEGREQERSVRQTLGYVRPGEVVIEFP